MARRWLHGQGRKKPARPGAPGFRPEPQRGKAVGEAGQHRGLWLAGKTGNGKPPRQKPAHLWLLQVFQRGRHRPTAHRYRCKFQCAPMYRPALPRRVTPQARQRPRARRTAAAKPPKGGVCWTGTGRCARLSWGEWRSVLVGTMPLFGRRGGARRSRL